MNAIFSSKISKFLIFCVIISSVSCKEDMADDEKITAADIKVMSEEATTDSYFQDVDDMAGVVVDAPDEETFNGRKATNITINDHRFNCDGIVVTLEKSSTSTVEHPVGTITADFGSGCTDVKGNIRTGKLIFSYDGRRFIPGSHVTVTPSDYTINGVKLTGERVLTNIQSSTSDAPRFRTVLTNGRADFSDSTFAERESDITFEWVRGANITEDKLIIDQVSTASGTTRDGKTHTMSIIEDVEYKRFCGIAVSGIKKFIIDGSKEISIDYGVGECDKSVTITVNGQSRTISAD